MSNSEESEPEMIPEEKEEEEKEENIHMLKKKTKRNKKENQTKPQKKKKLQQKEESAESEEEKEKDEDNKDQQDESEYVSNNWNELFIKNLSYKTTEKNLIKFFSKYGKVSLVKIIIDKSTNKSKGIGFCKFDECSSAAKAMKNADNLTLDGRQIKIRYSNEKIIPKDKSSENNNNKNKKHSIFVANLNFDSTEEGIRQFFKGCGKITDIRIAKKSDGKSRGFAHVDFDSEKSLNLALKKNNCRLDKRRLRLEYSDAPKEQRHRKEIKSELNKNNDG